jgi:hypothetical protein
MHGKVPFLGDFLHLASPETGLRHYRRLAWGVAGKHDIRRAFRTFLCLSPRDHVLIARGARGG